MRDTFKLFMILTLLLAASGCGGDDDSSSSSNAASNTSSASNDTSGADTGMTEADTGTTEADVDDRACPGDPGEPYGTSEGSNFLPFTFDDCDGNPYAFYGEAEGYCETSFTVVSIAGGWCGPCRIEAELMQEQLVEAYADQNVRVIVAIIQDNDFGVPDSGFCEGWASQYGLTNPVLLDPFQETSVYFPGGALPATLIVDSNGVIVHREYGVSDELATVRAKLDQLLSE